MAPMSSTITTVMVIGPSGNVGKPAVSHLLSEGFTVSGLTREGSQAELPAAVRRFRTDYSQGSLEAAFQGQDAVISTISGGGLQLQKLIIDVAIAADVKTFFPSEYGVDTSVASASEAISLLKAKQDVLDYLRTKQDKISWTALVTGSLFDWGLDIPGFGGFDVDARTATIYDGGDVSYEATTLDQTGRAIAAALQHPDDIKNQHVYVNSFTTTQNQVKQALERATGDSFTVSEDTVDNVRKEGHKQLQEGQHSGLLALVASVFYHDFGLANYSTTKSLWNERLGIGQEDISSVVESYIQQRKMVSSRSA